MRPLILSFWTPPAVRPRAIMAGKIIPELVRQGEEPVVMTYETCGDWNAGFTIYKIPEPYKAKTKNLLLRKIFSLWNERHYFNDLVRDAKKIIKKHDINVIFSFSNPQESNILGAMLKKRLGIPFISHFSDPWVDNPYKHFSGFGGLKARMLEKFVIENSDRIMFTNPQALKLVMQKYPKKFQEKARVMPHSFDSSEYPEIGKKAGKFVISHIGAFYKERTPEPLFEAVKKISDENPALSDKLEIKLVGAENDYTGYGEERLKELINKYGFMGIVKIIPVVSYRESLKFMKEADCLVVIDADFKNSPFFPSKAVDYAGSGTPIIGITPKESPTADFLQKLGYHSFEIDQVNGLARHLSDIISGNAIIKINKEFLNRFEVKNTVKDLISQFNEVLKV